ncbi:MAG: FABP family protein [Actinomycetota bacterium]
MDLHPDCADLGFLLGTWKGGGAGEYPTIEPFEYVEEVSFGHVGKPFLAYAQKTRDAGTGLPLHAEAGYLRAIGDGRVEFVLVQPSGIVELHSGSVTDGAIDLTLDAVHTSPAAKSVTDVVRELAVEGNTLRYRIAMAAVGEPLTHHLEATLTREP